MESWLLKIYLGEQETYKGKALFEKIVEKAKDLKMAGITVTKGILGFGADTHLHSATLLRFSENLPITIESIDSEEKINKFITEIKNMSSDCLMFKIAVNPVQARKL